MISMAIGILWFLIGAIALCGVVYLVLYGINNFISPIPPKVQQGIWFIVLLLVLIALLTVLGGGGMRTMAPFR